MKSRRVGPPPGTRGRRGNREADLPRRAQAPQGLAKAEERLATAEERPGAAPKLAMTGVGVRNAVADADAPADGMTKVRRAAMLVAAVGARGPRGRGVASAPARATTA